MSTTLHFPSYQHLTSAATYETKVYTHLLITAASILSKDPQQTASLVKALSHAKSCTSAYCAAAERMRGLKLSESLQFYSRATLIEQQMLPVASLHSPSAVFFLKVHFLGNE